MRRKIVAGNWKMNLLPNEGKQLITEVLKGVPTLGDNHYVIFCPSATCLAYASDALAGSSKNILLGAQNCHPQAKGAFTGETSISMLQALNTKAIIIGHSERREIFGETNAFIKEKVDAILAANLIPIFCCGEPLSIREANTQNEYVAKQIKESLFHLDASQIKQVVIAYEPIWAIGTGVTASTEQAQEMHASIRSYITSQYDSDTAEAISILYGGSCNASNAKELFSQPDVDGGLIGGASLQAETFLGVIAGLPS